MVVDDLPRRKQETLEFRASLPIEGWRDLLLFLATARFIRAVIVTDRTGLAQAPIHSSSFGAIFFIASVPACD